MRKKKGLRIRTLILFFIFFWGAFDCFGGGLVLQAAPVEEAKGWDFPLVTKEGSFVLAQTPAPAPAWAPKEAAPAAPASAPALPPVPAPATRPLSAAAPAPAPPPAPAAAPPSPPPAPAAAPAPPPPKPADSPKSSGFIFNFDTADLYEVIRVMADVMKLNYLIDPRVRGVVNIHTSGQISVDDIFPVFQSILQLNGATIVKKGLIYEIIPFGDAKKLPFSMRIDDGKSPEEKYMIQIVLLKYIPASEASKIIKPFLSDGADIIEHPPQNILLIGDMSGNIKKVLDVISLFDIDLFTDLRVRIYPLFNSDVTDIAKEIERIFASFEVSTKSGRGVGITFTPVTRINSLLVVSSIPNIFDKVEKWVKELDQTPAADTKLGVFVYYVQNGKAKDVADVLKQIFTTQKTKTTTPTTTTPAPTTPRGPSVRPATPTPAPPAPPPPGPPGEEGGVPVGEINIVVDETTNALIVRAYPRDYRYVLETIKKLDLYPKQVLIEVFLASITLDDTNKFGVEWSVFQGTFSKNGTLYKWALGMGGISAADMTHFTSGIRYAILASDKLTAAINALASNNKAQIISSPHLLASNNKEAKIQVGTAQPILTNTYTTGTIGTGTVEGTIEYKDIGIIITVTPRISDGGLVTMEISVENSDVSQTTLGNLSNVPVFSKKTAKTTLSITDAQTIVIGGLIQESKRNNTSGIPWFSKIPIFGALFGYQSYLKNRQELMVLLTPHVITDIDQSNSVTREFKEKLDSLRKDLQIPEK